MRYLSFTLRFFAYVGATFIWLFFAVMMFLLTCVVLHGIGVFTCDTVWCS